MNKSQARRKSVQGAGSKSNLSMSTSRTSMSNRRQSRIDRTGLEKSEKSSATKIQVIGDDGRDVTPKPLFTGTPHDRASQIQLEENSSSENFRSIASIFQTGMGTQAGMSLFGQSILGSASRASMKSFQSQVMSSQMSGMSVASDVSDKRSNISANQPEAKNKSTNAKKNVEELTPQDLEKNITIILDETETHTSFKLFGDLAQEETENIEQIKEENDQYLELCANREGNDKYVNHGMQTFNNALKDKQTNTTPVNKTNTGNQASTSILWDAYNKTAGNSNDLEKEESEEITVGTMNQSTTLGDNSGTSRLGKSSQSSSKLEKRTSDATENEVEKYHNEILKSPELQQAFVLIERIVSQNNYQRRIALYRGMDQLDPSGNVIPAEVDTEMKLNKLWSFQSPITKALTVTDITWNKVNPDIIAVSYGQVKGKKKLQKDAAGLVCCWNLKNLEHPERVYHTNSSALSVSFSQMSPNLLAVGLFNGVVLIYNVARKEDLVAIDSYDSAGKHTGPVWNLEWVERERGSDERGEVLISISHDGRVIQWTIRKGFEYLDLMKIKRTAHSKNAKNTAKNEHARISAFSPTLSFDFHPTDGNTYLVGTEEGAIHRCSCSYNEQTLDVYKGHNEPVYCVKWHPTIDNVFASCSEDWTIRIWAQKEVKHVIKLDNGTKPIRHIQWSKYSENLLLSITDAAIDIWDLTASILDPIMSMPFHPGVELNTIGIAPNSNCLFAGDSEGTINVYQIRGFNTEKAEAIVDLIDATLNSHD